MHTITTLESFKHFLKDHGVDYSAWGVGPTKTVDQLFGEYQLRESQFVIDKGVLVRKVKRVRVLVYYKTRRKNRLFLIEKRQRFANGSVRKRSRERSLSEKMLPGERPRHAALRALKEEVGVMGTDAKLLKKLAYAAEKRSISDSYPGLISVHYGPRFKVTLPTKWYRRRGYDEVQPDKTTQFRWVTLPKRK